MANQSSAESAVPYTGDPGVLVQDDVGFIWIGTETGLERYDGYRIRTYTAKPGDSCALQSENIWALLFDERKRLWIGTLGGGIARYDPETDCIVTVGGASDKLRGATIESLASDGAGGLWAGTSTGLLHVSADLSEVIAPAEDASEQGHLSHERVVRLLRDRSGALWVGSDHGLERRLPAETRFTSIPLAANGVGHARIRALFQSSDGRIWVGTSAEGAYVVDPATLEARRVEGIVDGGQRHGIWGAAETPSGEVWLATHDAGIAAVDPNSLRAHFISHQRGVSTSLPTNSVYDLLRDRAGLIWVASNNGWLGYFRTGDDISTLLTADETNGLPEGAIAAIAPVGDAVAVGVGPEVAILRPDGTGSERLPLDVSPATDKITSLATLKGHDLFVGCNPVGLGWIDLGSRRSLSIPLPGPGLSRHVTSLLADQDRVWVGAFEGIWVIEHSTPPGSAINAWVATQRSDLKNVVAIAAGSGDTRWFGAANGLFRLDGAHSTPRHIELRNSKGVPIADPFVTSLLSDSRGRLWIGTNSQGLLVLAASGPQNAPAAVTRQLLAELPNPSIDQILEDQHGQVWVAMDRGIARVDPDSFAVRAFGRGDGAAISNYWIGAGLASNSGELIFGGQGGMTIIRPNRFPTSPQPPPIVITRVSIGHLEVPSARYNLEVNGRPLDVPANAQVLSVEFAALDFADPERNSYAYRLDDYDNDWVTTGSDTRMAMYTNLSPGLYHLRIRGTDHAGSWALAERQISVRVAAAWYQTVWAHAVELLAALMLLVLIVQSRTVLLRARQRQLEALVEEKTQALVRANEERSSLIENLAHDLRTPLTSLRGYLERLSPPDGTLSEAERGRFAAIALRQAERLVQLVRQLFELVRLDDPMARLALERFSPAEVLQDLIQEFDALAQGRRVVCELDQGTEFVQIVGDISLFQRMIDNLVANAVHHTPADGKVTVRLSTDESSAIVHVSDTGQGIEPSDLERIFNRYERIDTTGRVAGAGLGLAIVKRILELHRGSIVVYSRVGIGTQFTVRWPRASPS